MIACQRVRLPGQLVDMVAQLGLRPGNPTSLPGTAGTDGRRVSAAL
jgi:hypothetical protein